MFHRKRTKGSYVSDKRWRENISIVDGFSKPPMQIYLFHCSNHGWSKIGISNRVPDRLKREFSSLPFPIELYGTFTVKGSRSEAKILEKKLHNYFSDRRINCEWFSTITVEEFYEAIEKMR